MLTASQRLKLDLLTDGISVSSAVRRELTGGNGTRPLTLADYASTSGVVLKLDGDIWVNAPIRDFNPNFVRDSPHRLECCDGRFYVRSDGLEVAVTPIPVPASAARLDPDGYAYSVYGTTHTDRVRISPIEGCVGGCRFCDLYRKYPYRTKPIERLTETIALALEDPVLPAQHALISGGTPRPEDFGYLNAVYSEVVTTFTHIPVDIMMVPLPGLLDLAALFEMGVHGLAINLELYDEHMARPLMPLKSSLPLRYWLDFIEHAVELFGQGRIRSLLMVGLEPTEQTVRGVEALAQRGCEPVLSPFRPDPATDLAHMAPPSACLLAEVYERSVDAAGRYGVKLGPRCIPCQHNTIAFPDGSDYYMNHGALL